jgi:hypothetical protein
MANKMNFIFCYWILYFVSNFKMLYKLPEWLFHFILESNFIILQIQKLI